MTITRSLVVKYCLSLPFWSVIHIRWHFEAIGFGASISVSMMWPSNFSSLTYRVGASKHVPPHLTRSHVLRSPFFHLYTSDGSTSVSKGTTVNSARLDKLLSSAKNEASISSDTEPDWSIEIAIFACLVTLRPA